MLEPDPALKPKLRGVSHQLAFFMAVLAGAFLVLNAADLQALTASAIYALCMTLMFGVSALYHRRNWVGETRLRMRRLDHSAIFLMIAGSYTPVAMLALPPETGTSLLVTIWTCTALAILQKVMWFKAPQVLSVCLYVLVGWLGLPYLPEIAATMGPDALGLFLASGVTYTGGALVYALRRPDPFPRTFGYHEVFHALVITGSALHFLAVIPLVCPG